MRTVRNALAAIEHLAEARHPLGVTELGRLLDLPPSSTHRLLASLVEAGFAAPVPDQGRYRAGPALNRIGAGVPLPALLREAAQPVMRRVSEATGEAVHLAMLEGTSVVAIDHVCANPRTGKEHPVGARMPVHATALGLALLAYHPELVDLVIEAGLERMTPQTIASSEQLRQQLKLVSRRGYATNLRGWYADTAGVAAPVVSSSGRAIAAIGVSGAAARLDRRAVIGALGTLLARAGREIGRRADLPGPSHPVSIASG